MLVAFDENHTMTPAAGAGIKYAIEDAVVAANLLAEPLKTGTIEVRHLAQVQRKRQWPTRVIQLFGALGMRAIARSLRTGSSQVMPRYLRWMFGLALFGKLMARLVAFGFWRVHVEET